MRLFLLGLALRARRVLALGTLLRRLLLLVLHALTVCLEHRDVWLFRRGGSGVDYTLVIGRGRAAARPRRMPRPSADSAQPRTGRFIDDSLERNKMSEPGGLAARATETSEISAVVPL